MIKGEQPKELFLGNAEARHAVIASMIRKEVRTRALEPCLPAVFRQNIKGKETYKRGNLARLLQSSKRQRDVDYDSLTQESRIARN